MRGACTMTPVDSTNAKEKRLGFSAAWDAFTSEVDLVDLDIDPDDVFSNVRDHADDRASDRVERRRPAG